MRFEALLLLLLGCTVESPLERRLEENRRAQELKLSETLTLRVQGGAIQRAEPNAPIQIRAQSLDLRIDLEDRGCQPSTLQFEVLQLPKGPQLSRRIFRGALSLEGAARAQIMEGFAESSMDLSDPDWTPLDAERSFEMEEGRWTLISDRGAGSLKLLPGAVEAPEIPEVACVTLDAEGAGPLGQAALITRHRLRWEPPSVGFSFAVWGNNRGHEQIRAQILEMISAQEELAFVLIGGDLSDGSWTSLELAREQLNSLTIPWFATVGEAEVESLDSLPLLGVSNFAFDAGPLRILMLDSGDATLGSRGLEQLKEWLSDEPLWWAGTPPSERLVLTHIPPFDPYGTREEGFKHRPEAARIMAALAGARIWALLSFHLATWRIDDVGGVKVYHAGGAGSPLEVGGPSKHFWLKIQVEGGCQALGSRGGEEGELCDLNHPCGERLSCNSGFCIPCLKIERIDLD